MWNRVGNIRDCTGLVTSYVERASFDTDYYVDIYIYIFVVSGGIWENYGRAFRFTMMD